MDKIYGSPKRQDGLYKVGRDKYELIYGFGQDEQGGWNWRQRFNYKPTMSEIREVIISLINEETNKRILTGFTWGGKPVWLSAENQMNFKSSHDIAVQSEGANLPVKFKLGEDENGTPVYHTFTKTEPFTDFMTRAVAFINSTLNEGWKEKDSVDWSKFEIEQ